MNKILINLKRLQKQGGWGSLIYAPYSMTIKQAQKLNLIN
jgi:hypothetical protein